MTVYTQGTYRNTIYTMVCCICKRLMMVKVAGKYLACLLPGLYIKGLIGKSDLSRGIVLCWNDFSCPHSSLSGSTAHSLLALPPTKKLFLSTTKYEEINGVINLSLRRRCRNPEESYRATTTTLENQIFWFRSRILSSRWYWRGEFWFFAYSNVFTSYNQETRNCKGSISCG